jgi:ergothioneine biosynthesis protein EgtB
MSSNPAKSAPDRPPSALIERFREIRARSTDLCRTLEPEDYVVQSMPSVSPTKWHLAHTTWFFEQFILRKQRPVYQIFNDSYHYLFNSYYYTAGEMCTRARRGLLSRPTVREIIGYRGYVDDHIVALLEKDDAGWIRQRVELGLQHEQQHQELMLTDIKHVFSVNPLQPMLVEASFSTRDTALPALGFKRFVGGVQEIGAAGDDFCFDNETPRHRVLVNDFEIGDRLVSNSEFREFIDHGGYRQAEHWLSDGWSWVQNEQVNRPLYWDEDLARAFTLSGSRDLDPAAPVCHLSFYEADAYARWAGARLPTEAEWEIAAGPLSVRGNFVESGLLHPQPLDEDDGEGLGQVFGDVWEWTASPYSAYPGFTPLEGSLGEYNGKFMCNQMVCRGGSCATPGNHVRSTYRNFFYPEERWQFFGIRLARDV